MVNKHMKRSSTSYVIMEMKNETVRDTTTYLSEWPTSGTLAAPNADEDVKQQELSFTADGNAKWYSHLGRQFGSWQFFTILNILWPYDPAIMLLDIYRKELKTYVHPKTITWMCIAALFINAKSWEQPRCPSITE